MLMKFYSHGIRLFVFSFLLLFPLSFCAQENSPVSNMDSLTEASHEHMLERQELEQVAKNIIEYPAFVAPGYEKYLEIYALDDVPSPRGAGIIGYISDPTDIIPIAQEQLINELLYTLEHNTTAQVAIVMLPSIGTEVPKDFAVKLFEKWGIGKSDKDNGLLVLTIMDQRRTEFEVGYGLEPILTDAICYRIGSQEVVPHFKNGQFGQGMISAVERIKEFIEDPTVINEIYSSEVSYVTGESKPLSFWWILILFLPYLIACGAFALWYYGVAHDIEQSKDDYYDKYHRLEKLKFGCLQFLFPFPFLFFSAMVKKRLQQYRSAPRYSKTNGKLLELKNEWTENDFLEAAQNLEEKLDSVRYDVWVTEDESDVMILEYEGPNGRKYSDCSSCGYKTYGKTKSKVTEAPSYDHGGKRVDYFECRNCNFQATKTVVLSAISRPSTSSSSGSSFSSSSSNSSSSFGGGSSGGGGSGVSW